MPKSPCQAAVHGRTQPHANDGQNGVAARGCPQLITPGDGDDDLHPKRRRQCSAGPHHDLRGVAQANAGSEHVRSSKVQALGQEADKLRKELIHQRLLTEDGQAWLQLQWSSEKERLEPTTAPVLPLAKAHEAIVAIPALVQIPGLLLRFQALRPLNKLQTKDGSTVVPWKMVIGHREEKAKLLYGHLQTVCHSAVTQLVLTQIRPANSGLRWPRNCHRP